MKKHKRKKLKDTNELVLFLEQKILKRIVNLRVASLLMAKKENYLFQMTEKAKAGRVRQLRVNTFLDMAELGQYYIFLVPMDPDSDDEICVLDPEYEWD